MHCYLESSSTVFWHSLSALLPSSHQPEVNCVRIGDSLLVHHSITRDHNSSLKSRATWILLQMRHPLLPEASADASLWHPGGSQPWAELMGSALSPSHSQSLLSTAFYPSFRDEDISPHFLVQRRMVDMTDSLSVRTFKLLLQD